MYVMVELQDSVTKDTRNGAQSMNWIGLKPEDSRVLNSFPIPPICNVPVK